MMDALPDPDINFNHEIASVGDESGTAT